jgi:hypothetical protein
LKKVMESGFRQGGQKGIEGSGVRQGGQEEGIEGSKSDGREEVWVNM